MSNTELTHAHGQAATGVHLPPFQGKEALALIVHTPSRTVTDAYYQELLGTTISMLLSRHTPLLAFSDCSSAIRRTQQALYTLGPAVGHLQHGALLQGLRLLATQERYPTTLTWTPSHPERSKKHQSRWTDNDWGIHKADALAGSLNPFAPNTICTLHCGSEDIQAVVTPPGHLAMDNR
jgi:hypothetical protein